jgi:hypothetical protein
MQNVLKQTKNQQQKHHTETRNSLIVSIMLEIYIEDIELRGHDITTRRSWRTHKTIVYPIELKNECYT